MKLKTIFLVIIFSVLIGLAIVWFGNKNSYVRQIVTPLNQNILIMTPSPVLTLLPLDQNSSLEDEINNLTPEDFSEDFKNLRDSI